MSGKAPKRSCVLCPAPLRSVRSICCARASAVLWRHTTSASSIWPPAMITVAGANKVSHDLCRLPLPQNGAVKRRSPPGRQQRQQNFPLLQVPTLSINFPPGGWIREGRKGGAEGGSIEKFAEGGAGGELKPPAFYGRKEREEGGKSHHHFWRLAGSSGRPRGHATGEGEVRRGERRRM